VWCGRCKHTAEKEKDNVNMRREKQKRERGGAIEKTLLL
jgi:hypothetical protein